MNKFYNKVTLKSILKKDNINLHKIKEAVININKLTIHTLHFIKLFLLHNQKTEINKSFFKYCIKVISNEKINEKYHFLKLFYDKYYKPLLYKRSILKINNLNSILEYITNNIFNLYQRHIKSNYISYYEKYNNFFQQKYIPNYKNFFKYLPNIIFMMKKLERKGIKIPNIFPLRTDITPKYITIDNKLLSKLFKLPNYENKYEQNNLWKSFFKMELSHFNKPYHNFGNIIQTDGVGCSILLINTNNKKVRFLNNKFNKNYNENFDIKHNMIDNRKIIQYETELSNFNRKTLDIRHFIRYLKKKNEINEKLSIFYENDLLRKIKLNNYYIKNKNNNKNINKKYEK